MNALHTHHHLHATRVVLFGVLLLGLFLVRAQPSLGELVAKQTTGTSNVLAYATNVNRDALLSATNSYRSQNGLAPLAMNGTLNSSSQSKALDMINQNYWAHVGPDGTQPWSFFVSAGYNYQSAGGNLAYGFDGSAAIVDAWMNSPAHKANMLGDYAEVGFGIANGESYQGGQNTVIVAHYGTPVGGVAPAATATTSTPAPKTPAPSPSAATPVQPTTPAASTPSAEMPTQPATTETNPIAVTAETAEPETLASPSAAVATAAPKSIGLIESVRTYSVPLAAIFGITLSLISVAGYGLTHRVFFQHAVASGEKFVMTHPVVDTVVVAAVAVLILTTSFAQIG